VEARVTIREEIRDRALVLGFDAVGFTAADDEGVRTAGLRLKEFLSQGRHGDMGWLAEKADRRVGPQALWPEARTVVMVAASYAPGRDPLALIDRPERGAISVYAQGADYHDIVKKRLKALGRWVGEHFGTSLKVFVDTAPVMEKPLAAAAGLGWQGKHTNLVSRDHGSWLFLGALYLPIELEPDDREGDHCGRCRACLDACPTAAFPAPYQLDARRCISYLTIEHGGPIPRPLRPLMGNRIYGCDDCLAVCPWNKFASGTAAADYLPRAELTAPYLLDLAALDDAAFRQVFAGSPIKRVGRNRLVRNVAVALGNGGDRTALPALDRLAVDDSPLVRGAAIWALGRLCDPAEFAARRDRLRPAETDAEVAAEWDYRNIVLDDSARPSSQGLPP